MRNSRPTRIKRILLGIIFITICAVISIFSLYRNKAELTVENDSPVEKQASISIRKFHQSSVKDGVKQWSMEAESAKYMDDEKKAIIQAPFVTFHVNGNETIYLTARQGILETDTNDIHVSGDVTVENNDYKLFSEKMVYQNKTRQFSSNTPVRIVGMAYRLAADSMWLNLNSGMAGFNGNVEGYFGEKLSF